MTAHATEAGAAPEKTERSGERRAEPASAANLGITRDDYKVLGSARDTGPQGDSQLQLPPGSIQRNGLKFEAANYDSIASILGLPPGSRMPTNGVEAFALLGRMDQAAKTADWSGGTPGGPKPPHDKVFEAS